MNLPGKNPLRAPKAKAHEPGLGFLMLLQVQMWASIGIGPLVYAFQFAPLFAQAPLIGRVELLIIALDVVFTDIYFPILILRTLNKRGPEIPQRVSEQLSFLALFSLPMGLMRMAPHMLIGNFAGAAAVFALRVCWGMLYSVLWIAFLRKSKTTAAYFGANAGPMDLNRVAGSSWRWRDPPGP